MNEDQIRTEALKMLDQHRQDAALYVAIVRLVVTLPVGQSWPTCQSCNGTLCGVCGACHLFDARLQGCPCPEYVADVERGACHAWRCGVGFLRIAADALSIKQG